MRRWPVGIKFIPIVANAEVKEFKHAAVAADHKDCSKIGADILKQGGNAVDAALATLLCGGVRNFYTSGLGGGGFMVIYEKKSGKAEAVDFRETAPSSMKNYKSVKEFCKLNEKTLKEGDGLTVGVPGELRGIEYAWKKYGKLPWKKIFEPAIALARSSNKVHISLANAIMREEKNIKLSKTLSPFLAPDGNILSLDSPVNHTTLADTLQAIADSGGSNIFYNGSFSQIIVNDLNENGGHFTLDDLANYHAVARKPVRVRFGGLEMISAPPPAGGVILGQIMNILKEYKMNKSFKQKHPAEYYHRVIEAFKYTHAPASFLSDPKFNPEVKEIAKTMLSDKEAKRIVNKIDGRSYTDPSHYGKVNLAFNPTSGTTHLSVIDNVGNAVSVTSSINKYFGSKIRSNKLGIYYNDQLQDALYHCRMDSGQMPDFIAPGKRPFSDACPTIVVDDKGDARMSIGAAGGHYIPTVLSQVIMNYFWFNESIKDAVDKPRVHNNLLPDVTLVENAFPENVRQELRDMGHQKVTNLTEMITGVPYQIVGVVQVVAKKDDGTILAYADPRKGGEADGF